MAGWMNSDGLYVKFGTEAGVSTHHAGEYGGYVAGEKCLEVVINLASLTQTETILNDVVLVPANALITRMEVQTLVAAVTGTAIDVGFIRQDRTTEIDYDGLLAAYITASMNVVGETQLFLGSNDSSTPGALTTGGALLGTEMANAGYISASMTDATAFTAGKIKVRVFYLSKGVDVTG
jgi:hypothetical protein